MGGNPLLILLLASDSDEFNDNKTIQSNADARDDTFGRWLAICGCAMTLVCMYVNQDWWGVELCNLQNRQE